MDRCGQCPAGLVRRAVCAGEEMERSQRSSGAWTLLSVLALCLQRFLIRFGAIGCRRNSGSVSGVQEVPWLVPPLAVGPASKGLLPALTPGQNRGSGT